MATSDAMQEYLAETYRLVYYQHGDPYISTSALAEALGVTAAAVTRMVHRLKAAGYLEHEPYQGIALTAEGQWEALMAIRRHRLVERFLVDVMKFGWHEVHDEADALGAAVSNLVVDRMEKMAGFPRRCPHGEPIPNAEGVMPRVEDYPLTEAETATDITISRVHSHDAEKLAYLESLTLKPGTQCRLVERAPFNGPLQLEVDGNLRVIGYELAGALRVCPPEAYELA